MNERAAAHRRGRLRGAMVTATARHGFPQITIEELARLAGISKRDFYASYSSKEECFLAAFDEIVDRGIATVRAAYRSGGDSRDRLLRGMGAFAQALKDENAAMSLAIVDSLSLGSAALAPRERAEARFAELLQQSLAQETITSGQVSEVAARGIVGGMRRVAYQSLRNV